MKRLTTEVRSQRTEVRGQRSEFICLTSAFYLLISVCCLLPALSFAAFEITDTGARQSGIGEAYTAIGGDIHSLLHNPRAWRI